jgi:hypothetical protein
MITTADVNTFILKRRNDVIAFGAGEDQTERKVSNGEINPELTTLKRILNLARQNGKLTHVPHIPMLKERNVRTGFFERGRSSGSSATCRRKNDEGRTFPFTDALAQVLEAQKAEHDRLKAEDVICPWVFNRTNKKVKGKRITTFIKAFRAASPCATWCAPAFPSAWPCR